MRWQARRHLCRNGTLSSSRHHMPHMGARRTTLAICTDETCKDCALDRERLARYNLPEVLRLHRLWLNSDPAGRRADLRGANLSWANLSGADLRGANLSS